MASPANLTDGVFVFCYGKQEILRASFRGIVAEEKGLKEAWDIKGQVGVKPCVSCQNIFNFIHKRGYGSEYKIGSDSVDPSLWILHTNESIMEVHDQLVALPPGKVKQTQTDRGLNLNRKGLIGYPEFRARGVIKPEYQYIRDYQHTYFSNGVAGIQLGLPVDKDRKQYRTRPPWHWTAYDYRAHVVRLTSSCLMCMVKSNKHGLTLVMCPPAS